MNITLDRRLTVGLVAVGLVVTSAGGALAARATANDPVDADTTTETSAASVAAAAATDIGKTETFTSVAPCRVLDTRTDKGGGGPLVDGATRNYEVTGNLSGQGGEAAGCGVPATATSIQIVLTGIATTSEDGYVRGWAAGSSPVTATLLNYAPALNASNQVTIPLCTGSCTDAFTLKNFGGTANIVGDVVGYHQAPLYVAVKSDGSIYDNVSSGVVSTSRLDTGQYLVTFDRSVAGCAVTATDILFNSLREVSADEVFTTPGETVQVGVVNENEVKEDTFFYLSVTC